MLRDLERPVAQADAADPNEEGVLSVGASGGSGGQIEPGG